MLDVEEPSIEACGASSGGASLVCLPIEVRSARGQGPSPTGRCWRAELRVSISHAGPSTRSAYDKVWEAHTQTVILSCVPTVRGPMTTFQENTDPGQRDSQYTNLGLIECIKDSVPVGVFRQVVKSPAPRYRILGLALGVGWEAGYFHLEGFSEDGLAYERGAQAEIHELVAWHEKAVSDVEDNYESSEGGRERTIASVVRRRGPPGFRRVLIEAYGGRCAISGCDAEAALEACHIRPDMGPETNTLSNGLLLRADLHTLFDLGLLAIDTASMTVIVARELKGTTYSEFAGNAIGTPDTVPGRSITEALDFHRRWTGIGRKGNLY